MARLGLASRILDAQPQVFNKYRRLENSRFPLAGCFQTPMTRAAEDCGVYISREPQIYLNDCF